MFENIECGHRFCRKCLMLSFALMCPFDKNTENMTRETLDVRNKVIFNVI